MRTIVKTEKKTPSTETPAKATSTTKTVTKSPSSSPKKVIYPKAPPGGSVKNHPLPVDVVKGKLDVSDVARAKTYLKRLSAASLGRARTPKEQVLWKKYTDRAHSYAKRINAATAAKKKK